MRHIRTGEEVDLYRTVVVRHFHTRTGKGLHESLARAHHDAVTAVLSIIHAWSKSADDDSIRLEVIRTLLKAAASCRELLLVFARFDCCKSDFFPQKTVVSGVFPLSRSNSSC